MKITISNVRGEKNNLIVTRTGLRFPRPEWARWRDAAVKEVRTQAGDSTPISEPTDIELHYYAGDKRRRDMPAVVDAVFHVLEKAGVVADDSLLWVAKSSRGYDKDNPRAEIIFNP